MATIGEISTIKIMDEHGNEHITYPKTKIEAVDGLTEQLNGKSASKHTHAQGDVTGLTSALNGKANTGHIHAQSAITGLTDALNDKVSQTRTINNKALNQNVTLNASDVGALSTSGGTMTGPITLSADPIQDMQAATKKYVDEHAGSGGGGGGGSEAKFHISSTQPSNYKNGDMWFCTDS